MHQAMEEIGLPTELIDRLDQSFLGTADWMRNR
jgi:hemoglobin